MTEPREVVSALMDGETDDLELRRLLKEERQQQEVRDVWQRYHRQQDSLHGVPRRFEAFDISERVMEALAQEPRPRTRFATSLLKPVSGLAVAATVAALVVFGFGDGRLGGVSETPSEGMAQEGSRVYPSSGEGSATGNVMANAPAGSAPDSGGLEEPEFREQFERYLRRHTERATLDGRQGMMSYTRAVNHEVE